MTSEVSLCEDPFTDSDEGPEEEPEVRWVDLCLRINNAGCRSLCGVCGQLFDAPMGLHLFTGAGAVVCEDCGDAHAAELMAVVRGRRQ